jgi:hypothetical protein
MGEEQHSDCPIWNKGQSGPAPVDKADAVSFSTRLPWSGAALGTTDLAFVTGRGEPKLVAVIGQHNAGKTTLLGLFYREVGRSGKIGPAHFAGSYSLEGWEAIAHALRWDGNVPRFPPHTSSGAGRAPGLLHLAMRAGNEGLSDVLFADSPGEWFHRWAIEPEASDAEGARWLIERASALLVVADCEALAGEDRGQARSDTIQLIRRIATKRSGRPVALVWTKADIEVPSLIRAAVTDAAKLVMPDIVEFEASVITFERDGVPVVAPDSVKAILNWTTAPLTHGFQLPVPPMLGADPFFSIGTTA